MKILNFGSLNLDYVYSVDHFVQAGETLSSIDLKEFSGGKGLNQTLALKRAGMDVYHAGAIGQDGMMLKELLESENVHSEFVKVLYGNNRTGHAIIQKDQDGDNCILLYGGTNRNITQEMIDDVMEHFDQGDYLVLQNEINNIPYLIQKAKEKGMVIVLNPSPMDDQLKEISIDDLDLVILNEIEAQMLLNCHAEGEELMNALAHQYNETCFVLTLGKEGSCYIKGECRYIQKAYQVKAVDTTAAGDTFTGYYLAAICRGSHPQEALNEASLASALAVTRKGAAPSIPYRHEVLDFKKMKE